MHKMIMVFALLFSSVNTSYANVEYVECYNNENKRIELVFGFDCDYINSHEFEVELDIYDANNILLASYNNLIKVIGKKEAIATIDYLYKKGLKVDVVVTYKETKLIDHIRLELVGSDPCYLGYSNRECNSLYKSVYKDNVVSKEKSNFKILYVPFDSFLIDNSLSLENIIVSSNYDISDAEIYLYLEEEIEGYNVVYDDGYKFLLTVNKLNNQYTFSLLEKHYLAFPEFSVSDEYNEGSFLIDKIYFPYLSEQKEYKCILVIKGKIEVEIHFSVFTSDVLYGTCDRGKYCLERVSHD